MAKFCDLHTHSTYSDGTCTPAEIIAQAETIGLSAVALTDHNTVAGLPDFMAAAQNSSVEAVPGTKVIGLDNENTAILEDLPEKITDAVIPNQILGSIVEESMMPYYQGSADFDSCYENMVQKVNLYLSE